MCSTHIYTVLKNKKNQEMRYHIRIPVHLVLQMVGTSRCLFLSMSITTFVTVTVVNDASPAVFLYVYSYVGRYFSTYFHGTKIVCNSTNSYAKFPVLCAWGGKNLFGCKQGGEKENVHNGLCWVEVVESFTNAEQIRT